LLKEKRKPGEKRRPTKKSSDVVQDGAWYVDMP
jgi:hypothetical protein